MTIFQQLLNSISEKKVYIQTHNFPDPDAIASAYALQQLLIPFGIQADICYKGKIDRSALSKMLESLHIDLRNVEDIKDMTIKDEVILVDAQKGNSNLLDIPGDEIICIDHHPTFEAISYRMSDIRPEVGSCASIIASYYFENHVEMSKNVATALFFGIKIDTANLTRGVSSLDLDMFYEVYKRAEPALMNLFELNTLQFNDLRAYANAIESIKVYDSISFANTGENCPEALIASISDFMLALSEVKFSVVYSRRKDGIKLSVRNSLPQLDAGKITNLALQGWGNGGGHASMAGGFVAYEDAGQPEDHLISAIEEHFLEVIEQAKKRTATQAS